MLMRDTKLHKEMTTWTTKKKMRRDTSLPKEMTTWTTRRMISRAMKNFSTSLSASKTTQLKGGVQRERRGYRIDLNNRYWHGTVALDAEKFLRLASGSYVIHFRFRLLHHKYLNMLLIYSKALKLRFGGDLSLCLYIFLWS